MQEQKLIRKKLLADQQQDAIKYIANKAVNTLTSVLFDLYFVFFAAFKPADGAPGAPIGQTGSTLQGQTVNVLPASCSLTATICAFTAALAAGSTRRCPRTSPRS